MFEILLWGLVVAVGINMAMFVPAYWGSTDKLTDISYAASFAALALYGLWISGGSLPAVILAGMIIIWSVRLGGYLLIRIQKMGRDKRFDGRREDFVKFGKFWLLQGMSVWVVLVPSLLFFDSQLEQWSWAALIGVGVWLMGLVIEAVADYQKFTFINNPANRGRWIDNGLWRYSRHPNYFGEITLWSGVYMYTLYGLTLSEALVGLVGPLYIAAIIIFVSGLPLLEKGADERWGDDPKYQAYKRRTSVLIPRLSNKGGEQV